jgi:4-amino-4-deoxy-L-arabinose transferase-like glycosyltransferase
MAYMDIADLIRKHQWAGVVNGYWHPLYPALLMVGRLVLHPGRWAELGAYEWVNWVIFLVSVVVMLAFVSALVRLRTRMLPSEDQDAGAAPLLSLNTLRLLGVGLVVIGAERELATNLVKPDALLQLLMLAGFAMLLEALASESLWFAPAMGLFFGLAYLTKSFAFLIALLSIAVLMVFQVWVQGRRWSRVLVSGALALVVFAAVAGPYVAALSKQKGRFDFGDSGALNYAWYVSGTDKMHLEPWMTEDFGSATVELKHPEKQLLAQPGVYSYKAEKYGTYPDWFDPTYFNERIVPKFNAGKLIKRDVRNLALVVRYLLNHPEAWVLLALLVGVCGARWGLGNVRRQGFWLPMVALGLAMWGIYGLVNIEERYVTLAYLVVVLPVFAALRMPVGRDWLRPAAAMLVAAVAFLALGETLRVALEARRDSGGLPEPWYSREIFRAAKGLAAMGVQPGDEIACIGTTACLHDPYWQRLAGVRVVTEVYNPKDEHLMLQLQGLANRQQVYDVVKAEGAKVLVASFDPGEMTASAKASAEWERLGETNFYALRLNLSAHASKAATEMPWTPKVEVAP